MTGTWEDVMFLCPDRWKFRAYGQCGVELNSMYFNQNYTAVDSNGSYGLHCLVNDRILKYENYDSLPMEPQASR